MSDNPFTGPNNNRTIIQPDRGRRQPTVAPETANPVAGPDSGNRTVIRPDPGRRQPSPAPPGVAPPQADRPLPPTDHSNRTIIRPNPGRRQPDAVPAAGANPQSRSAVAGPDDGNRMILRPDPMGRQPTHAPVAGGTLHEAQRDAPAAGSIAAPEGTKSKSIGEDALTAAAAPLLQLMAQLHNTVTPPDSGDLREWTVSQIETFERQAADNDVASDLVRPAHYALCAGLDDVVLNTPWGGSGSWSARPLVATFHRETGSSERFFEVLQEMSRNPRKFLPVIKVMYLCLSLGFMGRYRASPRGTGDIKRIRDETYAIIARQQRPADPELAPHTKGMAAPYRATRIRLPLWVAGSVGLGIVAALFAGFVLLLNTESDALYARARDAPPARMPVLARAAVEPQAAIPLVPPEQTALGKVRDFLQPEIQRGLVEVAGMAAQPLIRVAGRDMFASGAAAVQPGFKPLLDRIGQALKAEPGQVRVIGYTDDQSIRTIAFPSNAHLSAARAQAAGAIIAIAIGDASRISSEGRGDAEPIAANTTKEGRDRNNRIEIVLSRQGP